MTKLNKGQMSLEIIIAFIILLVVAAVVISMLFTQLNPDQLDRHTVEVNQMQFKNKCDALCSDSNSIDYCRYYFKGGKEGLLDWDGNGMKNELISVGETIAWDVCEDRLYCPLAVPCRRFGVNPIKGCINALCDSYMTKYDGDVLMANKAVLDKIKPGSCRLEEKVSERDNWHLKYFPEDVCGCECTNWKDYGIGVSGGGLFCNFSQSYQNRTCKPESCREGIERCKDVAPELSGCVYDALTVTISCKSNCEDRAGFSTDINVTDALGANAIASWKAGMGIGTITFLPGEIMFSTAPPLNLLDIAKDSWSIELSCSKPEGTVTKKGVN